MKIRRADKYFHPQTGERKYFKVEVECELCGRRRIVPSHELNEAVLKSKLQVKFKCKNCDAPPLSIHKQWFEFHTYKADLFPPW